jgi:hypothetical protein
MATGTRRIITTNQCHCRTTIITSTTTLASHRQRPTNLASLNHTAHQHHRKYQHRTIISNNIWSSKSPNHIVKLASWYCPPSHHNVQQHMVLVSRFKSPSESQRISHKKASRKLKCFCLGCPLSSLKRIGQIFTKLC